MDSPTQTPTQGATRAPDRIFLEARTATKSIPKGFSASLPPFTVITGENGAGKSQLLDALKEGIVVASGIEGVVRLYQPSNFQPGFGHVDLEALRRKIRDEWDEIDKILDKHRERVRVLPYAAQSQTRRLLRMAERVRNDQSPEALQFSAALGELDEILRQAFANKGNAQRPRSIQVLEQIATSRGVAMSALDWAGFEEFYPLRLNPADPLRPNINQLFEQYSYLHSSNKYRQFRASRGEDVNCLTDEQFSQQYGPPPWNSVNAVLELAELEFRLDPIDSNDSRIHLNFRNRSGLAIPSNDLSSGEKVLITLALALYGGRDQRQTIQRPGLLLFDEPDASLHPAMADKLLRVLQTFFVKEQGIPVITTTHSPSTIALAPPSSVFLMQKTEPRLSKVDADDAIRALLAGVSAISMVSSRRIQVFVESHHDAKYYGYLCTALRKVLPSGPELCLVAVGTDRNGGCAQVKRIVQQLRESGNRTVFGVVDWDGHNEPEKHVKVLGQGTRYSIESVLADPVLLGAFLWRKRCFALGDLGLPDGFSYVDFAAAGSSLLQSLADSVVGLIRKGTPSLIRNNDALLTRCQYVGGQVVEVPRWYLEMNGHQLISFIKAAIPALQHTDEHQVFDRSRPIGRIGPSWTHSC